MLTQLSCSPLYFGTDLLCQLDLLLLLPPQVARPPLSVGRVHLGGKERATLAITVGDPTTYKHT